MRPLLKTLLLFLLPAILAWVAWQERRILKTGEPLTADELDLARRAGVRRPEKVRLLWVKHNPVPLVRAGVRLGLLPAAAGADWGAMTLRHGILFSPAAWRQRGIVAHELVHTAQYERLGGLPPFLWRYLAQCIEVGYPKAPLEMEAVQQGRRLVADKEG